MHFLRHDGIRTGTGADGGVLDLKESLGVLSHSCGSGERSLSNWVESARRSEEREWGGLETEHSERSLRSGTTAGRSGCGLAGGNYAGGRSDQMCISSLNHPMPACLLIHGKSSVECAIVGEDRERSIEVIISDQVDIQFIGIDGDE